MRIAVTGLNGQIAQSLREATSASHVEIISLARPEFDLTDATGFHELLKVTNADVVVSAAAYTNVEGAETDARCAYATNATGAGKLAEAAAELDMPIVHISTDYVFDGKKAFPYLEGDAPGPINVYGASKLAGEKLVAGATTNHVILRASWIYSPFASNFVKTMLRLAKTQGTIRVVADQQGAPCYGPDIADAIVRIAQTLRTDSSPDVRGVFHYSSDGETTWAAFAEAIFDLSGRDVRVARIGSSDFPTLARRPQYSVLCNQKLRRHFGITPPHWRASLASCLSRLCSDTNLDRRAVT